MPLILLAEDESSTIDHVRSALASQGWLVKTVGTRDQALRAASEFAPQLVLVNDTLNGAEDLIRTFSRHSGGPGVVLLTTGNDSDSQATAASADVDAILAKPLDTADLIETIRRGLVDGKGKPTPPPAADTNKVFSSQEIFGDLLDDILDPDAEAETEGVEASSAPPAAARAEPVVDEVPEPAAVAESEPPIELEEAPAEPIEPVVELAAEVEPEPATELAKEVVPEPIAEDEVEEQIAVEAESATEVDSAPVEDLEPATGKAAATDLDPDGELEAEPTAEVVAFPTGETPDTIPVAGLEDLEEVVREGVEAWADSMQPEDTGDSQAEELAELEEVAQARPEPEPEPEEDLESRLEDTLAGVLADSLSGIDRSDAVPASSSKETASVDALLSQALGGLDLSGASTAPALDEVPESKIDDEIEALTASVHVEPIAEIEQQDASAGLDELAGLKKKAPEVEPPVQDEGIEPSLDSLEEEVSVEVAVDEDELESEPEPIEEPVSPPPATPKGIEFGEYTLEQQIGVGGMASVWKARRKGVEGFEKRVAIKKILPQAAENEDFVEMFIDEAKLAAQLNHSNITHIYDLGKIDDDYFIAMEYVEGRNLRQILDKTRKKKQQVPVGVALFIASQIADALDYAHRSKDFDDAELGLVHRDVSPQNVLISFSGDIKLCDFGIAKAVSKISTTQMGALKGKLQYMSPEQAWGKSIDHRSDLFSLGSLLYEMLTGQRLFTGESEMAVLEAVREADVGARIIQSADIPAGVKGILLKALSESPKDRFESAEELQRGLEELIKDESPAPGTKSVSAFVRELLEMQAEPTEPAKEATPENEIAEDLEWDPDSRQDETAEDETTPWLKRVLTRLLPVILVVAVGGGILASLMQKDAPAADSPPEQISQIAKTPALEEPVTTTEQEAVAPQGQPPPTLAAAEPTPAPPAQPQTQEPEPEPATAEKPLAEDAVIEEATRESAEGPSQALDDPELERRVEEDLQRVQELMTTSADSVEAESTEENTAQTEPKPLTLESLWSDVIAAEETDDQTLAETEDVEAPGAAGSETREGDLVQPGPGITEPTVLEFAQPEYSEAAQQAGAEGTIRVSVLVDENGQATDVKLTEGLAIRVGLEEAVIESARNAVYSPASKDGIPVKMWYEVAVLFEP